MTEADLDRLAADGKVVMPEHLITHGVLALLGCLALLVVSQWVFTRLENKIPERL